MTARIYHYTDRLSALHICLTGRIRARPLTLHRDVFRRDGGRPTPPAVWFTTAAEPEPTVVLKLRFAGWPPALVGDLWRFAVPADYPGVERFPEGEGEPALGCDPVWWRWVLVSASLCWSMPRDWRVVTRDVPLADVVAVEVLSAAAGDYRWTEALPCRPA